MSSSQAAPGPSLEQWSQFLDYEQRVSCASTVTQVLQSAADAIVGCDLYRRAVITLHDEHGNLGPIGFCGVPKELIDAARRAPRVRKDVREAILQDQYRISESFYVPVETAIDLSTEGRHIPSSAETAGANGWQAGDELFTPLRRTDGSVMGFCSVDEPPDGSRPEPQDIGLLEMIVNRAAARTEVFLLQDDLATERKRLTRLIRNEDDVVYEIAFPNQSFTSMSAAADSLFGVPSAEITGMMHAEWMRRFVHADDRNRARVDPLDIPRHPDGGGYITIEREYRILRADGTMRWVRDKTIPIEDDDGQVIALEGLLRDITAVRLLSGKLVRAEERYRLMADNARDLIYAHDASGRMFYVSPSVQRYLGVTPREFLGTHFSEWVSDNPMNGAAFDAFDSEINEGTVVTPFMLELRAKDGHTFLMEFNESLIRDDEGRVVGVQGVGRDVSEREETLASLRDHRKRLDAANTALKALVNQSRRRQEQAVELTKRLQQKNAELESFVQIIAHDMRSPLITVRGLTGQLRRRFAGRLDERGQEIIRQIGGEALRLSRLIGDVLLYARAGDDPGARRIVDVGLVIDAVWTRLAESGAAKDARLSRPPEAMSVWADPVAFERVLENILTNAVTHRHPQRPCRIDVRWSRSNKRAEIAICDNGIGIEAQDRDRVFELFYRGRNACPEGSGLGLAIVERIVRTSGATISVAPNADGGTVFTLEWPQRVPRPHQEL
jgi:PAS domain S-box-containing protein